MLSTYCDLLGFPKAATEQLTAVYRDLSARFDLPARFLAIRSLFLQAKGSEYLEMLQTLAEESGADRRTLDMLFLLWCAPALREAYEKRGISDTVFVDTLTDLRYKLLECYANYGVWGTFVTFWYRGFYRCERFALGRLQFERRHFKHPAYGHLLREGDAVLGCHIPSSGPLDPKAVINSLRQAYHFYQDVRRDGVLPVTCHSWLLYPPHRVLFGENTKAFYDLFDIVSQDASTDNADYWRIFNTPFSAQALAHAPEDTAMRRRFKQFLLAGNMMGSGYGLLLFDGERVLTRKE